ncbi:acyl-CoA dehydrogenase [Rhodococcus aerolatus]
MTTTDERPTQDSTGPATGPATLRGGSTARALTDVLDGRWAHVRRWAREQPDPTRFAPVYGESHADARDRVRRLAEEVAQTGQTALGFVSKHGGGDDPGGSVASIEMLAYGDLSLMVKAGVQWGLFGGAVQALGTERHHAELIPSIIDLSLPGCFAMTETGHGSDVQQLRTTCTYDPATQTFDLHTPHESARKDYIGGAAHDARTAVVFAQLLVQGEQGLTGYGVHAWVVPIRHADGTPCDGVTPGDDGPKAGLNGVDNGRLSFDHVTLPREALLDRYGSVAEDGTYSSPIDNETKRFFTMLGTLVRGRISVGGSAGSAAKVALDIAVRYGDTRRQFAAPGRDREVVVLDYLAHQRVLLPALAKSYALHFAQEELVVLMHELLTDGGYPADATAGDADREKRQRELESRAAGVKAVGTWHASRTIQACREACGGAGYLAENRLPQLRADIDVFTTFEGDNTVLMQLVAKGLLTGFRDDLGDMSGWGKAQFAADQVVGTVLERTAARGLIQRLVDAVPGREEDVSLLDRGWQLALLEDREKHVLEGAALRLRSAADPDKDPFAVFNAAQDHVLATAHAHVDRVLLEAFVAAVEKCADPAAKQVLSRLCDLFALSTIEADRAWFLEHGRLTPARSKAITSAVNELCGRVRQDAITLVDAFAIPREWMACAILDEEGPRQEATHAEDQRAAAQAEPDPGATATDVDVAPAQ